jgi:hypothetical protein
VSYLNQFTDLIKENGIEDVVGVNWLVLGRFPLNWSENPAAQSCIIVPIRLVYLCKYEGPVRCF